MENRLNLTVIPTVELIKLIESAVERALVNGLEQPSLKKSASSLEVLTFNQACLRLRLSAPTLRKMLRSGAMHGTRAGSR